MSKMTVVELRDKLNELIEEGAGDALVIIEEEGDGYFGDLINVDTWLQAPSGDTLLLLGESRFR